MIITSADIRNVRPIAENLNDDKRIAPYIAECESLYLMQALGATLYQAIESNVTEYATLLNGGYYTDRNGTTQHCEGIKKAMGYLVYSRFVKNQSVNVTAFGVVAKTSSYSDAIDEKTLMRVANDAEAIGNQYLQGCIAYCKSQGLLKHCEGEKVNIVKRLRAIG